MKDYYKILGVAKDADQETIKKAYRKLAMKYHPDHNQGDKKAEEQFKEITEANEILSNPKARHAYDNPSPLGGFNPNDFFSDGFFNQFFGNFRRPTGLRVTRGQNYNVTLEISLYDAICGTTKKIKLKDVVSCYHCTGSGFAKADMCKTCNGSGKIVKEQKSQMLVMRQEFPCQACRGKGQIPIELCDKCKDGRIEKDRIVEFEVKPDTGFGQRLGLKGQGGKSLNGGPPGDLFITLVFMLPKKEDLTEQQLNLLKEVSYIGENIMS